MAAGPSPPLSAGTQHAPAARIALGAGLALAAVLIAIDWLPVAFGRASATALQSLWHLALAIAAAVVLHRLLLRRDVRLAAADAALRASEERLHHFSRISSDWYWETDADHRLARVVGYTPRPATHTAEYLLGRRLADMPDLVPVDLTPAELDATRSARRAYRNLRFHRTTRSGRRVVLDVSAEPRFDAAGTFLGYRGISRDVTAEATASERLHELEERHRVTFNLAGLGISEVDLEGRFLRVNPAFCRITGYDAETLLTMSGNDITPAAQERDVSHERMQAAIRGEIDGFSLEKRYLRRDGGEVWVELTSALARDKAGQPAYFVTITQDISERHATTAALAAGEARYRSLIDHMSAGLVQHGPDGAIIACNRVAPLLLGLSEEQIFARAPLDPAWHTVREDGSPLPPEEHPSFRVLRSGRPVYNEIVGLHRSDGSLAWLQVSSAVIPGPPGQAHGAIVTFNDVTAERQAVAALRDSESRYRSVIETMDEAILLLDGNGRTIGSNPAARRVFGIDDAGVREAGPFHPKLRLFGDDGRELAAEERPSYRAIFGRERVIGATYRAVRPDGSEIAVEINARPLALGNGAGSGGVVTLTDISERVAAQRELRTLTETLERRVGERTAELSQLNRELESFAYSVSHDLRAPLRAITGFASLLAEDERARLSPEGIDLLERIGANAERMGELIDDVLEYSRVTRIDRKREDVDLDVLVEEVAAPLRQAHPDFRWVAQPLGRVTADPAMLRQVFDNLVGNAFKYVARAAQPEVRVEAMTEAGRTWFQVADNGVGFDMRYADRLFGLFQRMHPASDYPGTGVGLAIVKRLIERHGGAIEAWAEPGHGARFRFHLGDDEEAGS